MVTVALPVRLSWLPPGDAGTRATLRAMRAEVHAGLLDPAVRTAALGIIRHIPARDGRGHADTLRRWLGERWRFVRDPDGVEYVLTPREQLERLYRVGALEGDCDDAAVLGATLGKVIGLPARFRALAFGGPYRHVVADLLTPAGWRDLDVTAAAQRIPPTISRTLLGAV